MAKVWTYSIGGESKRRTFTPSSSIVDEIAEEAAADYHDNAVDEESYFELELFCDGVSVGRRSIEVERSYSYFVSEIGGP